MLTWTVVLRTPGSQLGSAGAGGPCPCRRDCLRRASPGQWFAKVGSHYLLMAPAPQLPSSQTRDWTQSLALRDGCPGWSLRRKTCAGSATWVNVRLLVGGSRRARRLCAVMRQKLEPLAAGTVEVRVSEHLRVDERCWRGVDAE